MAAEPLALASPALIARVRSLTEAAVTAWQARWGLDRLTASVGVTAWEEGARPKMDADGQWLDAQVGSPASVFWPASAASCIERELFGGAGPLARDIACQVTEDLQRALLASWHVPAPLGQSRADLRWSRWSAPVHVDIELMHGCRIVAVLAAAQLRERTPPVRCGLGTLDARCFDALPAQAELMVGRAEVALPDIAALQVGDVIALDARIHDPLPLRVQGGRAIVHACLGRTGDRRAAQLVSNPKTQGPK